MNRGDFLSRRALVALALVATPAAFATSSFSIVPTFDATITGDANAAAIEADINNVIAIYNSTFLVPGPSADTVHITFKEDQTIGLGESSTFFNSVNYTTYCAALVAAGTPGSGSLNCATDPFGGTTINLKTADIRALGLTGGNVVSDGTISLKTDITNPGTGGGGAFVLDAVVSHEIDEVLGLGSGLDNVNSTNATITAGAGAFAQDLFRYTGVGALAFNVELGATCNGGNPQTTPAYFSTDGGATNLAGFNNACNGGDWGDWDGGSVRVQNAFATPGANPALGPEITALEAVGFQGAAPEPATFGLMGAALAGLLFARRRKSN